MIKISDVVHQGELKICLQKEEEEEGQGGDINQYLWHLRKAFLSRHTWRTDNMCVGKYAAHRWAILSELNKSCFPISVSVFDCVPS